ncbi:MAG: hypothetical protein E5X64_24775 [Mesorhizobium sp.]|nr:MAG: hypothetical protein E5X64_24775 [Mesorhizobium sp.]
MPDPLCGVISFSQFSYNATCAARDHVGFLTPNTGSDDYADRAISMPSLGGASAQPLRFLDFLIHEPIRTVLLHRSGVPVVVPSPGRYAVHKLIVASRRQNNANGVAKREKDVYQAALLVEALEATRRQDDLAIAFSEAWARGKHWRNAIQKGLGLIAPETAWRRRGDDRQRTFRNRRGTGRIQRLICENKAGRLNASNGCGGWLSASPAL